MKNVIRKAEYLETDGRFKLVVQTRAPVFDAALRTEGGRVPDAFNRDEPYDRTAHGARTKSHLSTRSEKGCSIAAQAFD